MQYRQALYHSVPVLSSLSVSISISISYIRCCYLSSYYFLFFFSHFHRSDRPFNAPPLLCQTQTQTQTPIQSNPKREDTFGQVQSFSRENNEHQTKKLSCQISCKCVHETKHHTLRKGETINTLHHPSYPTKWWLALALALAPRFVACYTDDDLANITRHNII